MRHTLKEGVSTQVILTVSQIMWCRDMTDCLEKEDGNRLEALEAFENVNFEVRLWHSDNETFCCLCKVVSVASTGMVIANLPLQKS